MTERYYAQSTIVPEIFRSLHTTAWLLFDRERLSPHGEAQPIAMFVNRNCAFEARDALNERERKKNEDRPVR